MGNFNLSIRGIGHHHNTDLKTDVDRMARRFVRELEEAGHRVSGAELTYGGAVVYASEQVGVTAGLEDKEQAPAAPASGVVALLALLLGWVFFAPAIAFADTAPAAPAPDSFSALLLQHVLAPVLTALGGLLAWALKALVDYLKEKGKESKTLNIVAVLTESVRSMVAQLNATLRPQLEAALADGVLTDAEKTKLKETAIETVKKSLPAATLNTAKSIFGDFLDPFLGGLVERAVLDQKAAAAVANPPAP